MTSLNVITKVKRALGALLLLAALASLAGGCGTASVSVSPEAVAKAADVTLSQDGMRTATAATFSPESGKQVTITGTGVEDLKGKLGRIDMDLSKVLAASGKHFPADKAVMHSVFQGSSMYMSSPLFGKELKGKKWMKIDVGKAQRTLGLSDLPQVGGNDPAEGLDYLRGAGDVKKIDSATIRGAKTTHYRSTIDLDRYANTVPQGRRDAAKAAIARWKKLFGSSRQVSSEVWVDGQNRIRRLRTTWDLPLPGQTPVKIDQTIDYFDFGTAVAVQIPPKSEVADLTSLAVKSAREQQRKP